MKLIEKDVEIEKTFSFSWILMWSLAYIACSFLKPDLVNGVLDGISFLLNPSFGIVMLLALLFRIRSLLFACGVLEVFAGVASWVGFIHWNIPWNSGYDPLAQISMALLDLISAVFLFNYSFTLRDDTYNWK